MNERIIVLLIALSVPLFGFAAFVGLKNAMTVETPVAAAKVDVDDDQNNNMQKFLQGGHAGRQKPPVDIFLIVYAAGGSLLKLPTACKRFFQPEWSPCTGSVREVKEHDCLLIILS